jgi:hypothetical protein
MSPHPSSEKAEQSLPQKLVQTDSGGRYSSDPDTQRGSGIAGFACSRREESAVDRRPQSTSSPPNVSERHWNPPLPRCMSCCLVDVRKADDCVVELDERSRTVLSWIHFGYLDWTNTGLPDSHRLPQLGSTRSRKIRETEEAGIRLG